MRVNVGVDDNGVFDSIEREVLRGARRGLKKTADSSVETAQDHLERRGAIWTWQTYEGFRVVPTSDGYIVRNTARHADYVDKGVSGIYVKRDTPYAFTDRGPPLEKLLPWFLAKLG